MRIAVSLAALAAGAACLAGAHALHAAPRAAAKPGAPGSAAARKADSYRWLMIDATPTMKQAGGGEQVVAICRRAARAGYNGLLLWDQNLWAKALPAPYRENARVLRAGLRELNFTLIVEMCPRGWGLIEWSGDPTIVEPRPAKPTPEERNYRYLCLAHPGVLKVWEEQLVRANDFYGPDGWLLQYDEIRVSGDDERCRKSGKKPAQLLAEHTRAAIQMCRRITPGAIVGLWNDMYDPHHNARKGAYYHVKDGFYGAWEGVDRDVLIFNWNDALASYDFWAKRGNRQIICGYYDGEMGPEKEAALVRAARQRPGVVGYMYTTWHANFSGLESYLALTGFTGPAAAPASRSKDPVLFLDRKEGRK